MAAQPGKDTTSGGDLSPEGWARLVSGCRRRDTASFTELVARTERRLRRLIARLAGARADVDELLQETYLRSWSRIDRFRGDSSLITWMTRIAINVTLNWRRDRRPTVTLADGDRDRLAAPCSLHEDTVAGAYAQALEALPEELRFPFVLHESEELTYRQIADLLECPIGTVMSRLHRARAQLLSALSERLEEMVP